MSVLNSARSDRKWRVGSSGIPITNGCRQRDGNRIAGWRSKTENGDVICLMEGSFADAANNHGLKRARWRGLIHQQTQDHLIAA